MEKVISESTKSLGLSTRLQPLVTGTFRGLWEGRGNRNAAQIDPRLVMTHWPVLSDGMHNLTTDLCDFQGYFYLVFSSSPWHIGSHRSRIRLLRSKNGLEWESVRDWSVPKGDIRDPKLSVIDGKLILFVLRNDGVLAEPGTTAACESRNGVDWGPLEDCEPRGWLFWRPKTVDGKTWFLPAYWCRHGKSILLKSEDGRNWTEWSTIHEGDHNDETDIEILPDGRMIATARLEINNNLLGHHDSCTLIAVAEPPYKEWRSVRCTQTRLDGPNLFRLGSEVYALGRRHDDTLRWPVRRGSIMGRKRTALYKVTPEGLIHLSDLPSAGDTGYPGIVIRGDDLYVSYYTNDIERDYRWGVGMFLPSEIRMARLSIASIAAIHRIQ